MTFWSTARRYPPVLCRLAAKHPHGAPFTDAELVAASGLSPAEIRLISARTDWNDIPLTTMQKFLAACRTDFCNARQMHRLRNYLRFNLKSPNPWRGLRKSDRWLSYYEPLLVIYRNHALSLCQNLKPKPPR